LLNYAWMAGCLARGAEPLHITWPQPYPDFVVAEEVGAWVAEQLTPALDAFPIERPVLVGKSLGAYAMGLAADRGLPAIWLTPHLVQEWELTQLRRATAPYLLIGGTADPVWRGDVARELTPHVLEIPGANHGMVLADEPLARSAHVLGQIATAYENFLDEVVWPARSQ
jgi:pimeloyl-ACP methyl ester carboxylesterase